MWGKIETFFKAFFSDADAKRLMKQGYVTLVLGLLLALVLLFAGAVAADNIPMLAHFEATSQFREVAQTAFMRGSNDIDLTFENGKLAATDVVDTYKSEADAAVYGIGGYNVVIDARPATALDDFEAFYLSNDGAEREITMEEYATLSDVAKYNFDFKIRYTDRELVLTDERVATFEAWLAANKADDLAAIDKDSLSDSEYALQVYELYVKAYYPDLSAYEPTGSVPMLRNYYYNNYVRAGATKYLFVFDDSVIGCFETNGGQQISFYGYPGGLDGSYDFSSASEAEKFVLDSFKATSGLSAYMCLMNILRTLPFFLAIPFVLALLAYSVLKIIGAEWIGGYMATLKLVGGYQWMGALIAAVCTLLLSFAIPRGNVLVALLVIYFAVLLVRVAVLLIKEKFAADKLKKAATSTNLDVAELMTSDSYQTVFEDEAQETQEIVDEAQEEREIEERCENIGGEVESSCIEEPYLNDVKTELAQNDCDGQNVAGVESETRESAMQKSDNSSAEEEEK